MLIFCSGLDNAVRIRDKMQVVYQEMARDGRKSYVAKMNLIGGIHIKHVKNCLMFIKCNNWVCSDGTLDIVFLLVMECTLFSGCVVREGAKKKPLFNLKTIR